MCAIGYLLRKVFRCVPCSAGGAWSRWAGWLLVVRGRGPAGCDSGWPERCLLVVRSVGTGVVLHILSGVLVGVVAWFQRFPALGGRPEAG